MQITIGRPRKDGKTPVSFNAGYIGKKSRVIKYLVPNKYFKSIEAIKAKYPDANYKSI